MATQPVTLDFSKAVPLNSPATSPSTDQSQQQDPTLDFSKAQQISEPPQETGVWAGVKRNTVGAVAGLYHALTDPATPQEKADLMKKVAEEQQWQSDHGYDPNDVDTDLATNPSKATLAYHRLIDAPLDVLSEKSKKESQAADDLWANRHLWAGANLKASAGVDKVLSALPLAGPFINSIAERAEKGDVSGALTDIAAAELYNKAGESLKTKIAGHAGTPAEAATNTGISRFSPASRFYQKEPVAPVAAAVEPAEAAAPQPVVRAEGLSEENGPQLHLPDDMLTVSAPSQGEGTYDVLRQDERARLSSPYYDNKPWGQDPTADQTPYTPRDPEDFAAQDEPTQSGGGSGQPPPDNPNATAQAALQDAKDKLGKTVGGALNTVSSRALNKSMGATATDLLSGNPANGIINNPIRFAWTFKGLKAAVDDLLPEAKEALDRNIKRVSATASGDTPVLQVGDLIKDTINKYRDQITNSTKPIGEQTTALQQLDDLQDSLGNEGTKPENARLAKDLRTKIAADLSVKRPGLGPLVEEAAQTIEKSGRTPRQFNTPERGGGEPLGLSPIDEVHHLKEQLSNDLGKKAQVDPATGKLSNVADQASLDIMNQLKDKLNENVPGYKDVNQNYEDLQAASRVLDRKLRSEAVGRMGASPIQADAVFGAPTKTTGRLKKLTVSVASPLNYPAVSSAVGKVGNYFAGIPDEPRLTSGPLATIGRPGTAPLNDLQAGSRLRDIFTNMGFSEGALAEKSPTELAKLVTPDWFSLAADDILNKVEAGEAPITAARQRIQQLNSDWAEAQRLIKQHPDAFLGTRGN